MAKKYYLKEEAKIKDKNRKEVLITKEQVIKMYEEIMKDEFNTGFVYYLEEIK